MESSACGKGDRYRGLGCQCTDGIGFLVEDYQYHGLLRLRNKPESALDRSPVLHNHHSLRADDLYHFPRSEDLAEK